MNLRTFLGSIPMVGLVTSLPKTEEKPKFYLEEPIPPINKILCFTHNKLDFKIMVTDQILIPGVDGSIELNVYGTYCKIIAKVVNHNPFPNEKKYLRLESEIFDKKEVELVWQDTVNKFINKAEESFKIKATTLTTICPKLKA